MYRYPNLILLVVLISTRLCDLTLRSGTRPLVTQAKDSTIRTSLPTIEEAEDMIPQSERRTRRGTACASKASLSEIGFTRITKAERNESTLPAGAGFDFTDTLRHGVRTNRRG